MKLGPRQQDILESFSNKVFDLLHGEIAIDEANAEKVSKRVMLTLYAELEALPEEDAN